jgi:Fic family protein
MFRSLRLRRIHARFLESCRSLKDGRDYWAGVGPLRRWLLRTVSPIPLLGLHEDGSRLLAALRWLEESSRSEKLTELVLKRYHEMIGAGAQPGHYRTSPATVVGSPGAGAAPDRIPGLMRQLDFKLARQQEDLDAKAPVDPEAARIAALSVYERIGVIHPFADGNGRVARLAMNHLLRRYGLAYVILPPLSESPELHEALREANRGDLRKLREMGVRFSVSV